MTTNLPLPFKTTADFEYLRRVIMREETEGPVPIIEMMADPSFMDSALGFTGMNVPRTRSVFSGGDGQESTRPWQNEHSGQITDRASFEAFPWPDVTSVQVDSITWPS
ncbi:MAG: hypothetical protein JRJ27_00765 [Deltaproteobacteria bacterium]|nr:hypothetical protein [Deltaproteobacteria bacterium]